MSPTNKEGTSMTTTATKLRTEPPKVVWGTPPPPQIGRPRKPKVRQLSAHEKALRDLQSRPGSWARVQIASNSSIMMSWRQRGCQVTTRKRSDGRTDIWASWPVQPA